MVNLLGDVEYAALQMELALHPEKGGIIRETGGARKIRVRFGDAEKVAVRE